MWKVRKGCQNIWSWKWLNFAHGIIKQQMPKFLCKFIDIDIFDGTSLSRAPVELRYKSSEDSQGSLLNLLNLRKAMHRYCKTWKMILWTFRRFSSSCRSWKKTSESLEDYYLLVSLGRKSSQSSKVLTSWKMCIASPESFEASEDFRSQWLSKKLNERKATSQVCKNATERLILL